MIKNYKYSLVAVALLCGGSLMYGALPGATSDMNQTSKDIYLQGNYIGVGISTRGTFGTDQVAPSGFFPCQSAGNKLGLCADLDGFNSGNAAINSDFFLPGSRNENFAVGYKVGGTSVTKYNDADPLGNGTSTVNITRNASSNLSDANATGTKLQADWNGTSNDNNVTVNQLVTFDVNKSFYETNITIRNISGNTLNNVRYMRTFDPEPDQIAPWNSYNVDTSIVFQPNSTDNNYSMVKAVGSYSRTPFFFFADSNKSRVQTGGQSYTNVFGSTAYFESPQAIGHTGTNPGGDTITITFDAGTLAPGEEANITYYSSLDANLSGALANILGITPLLTPNDFTFTNVTGATTNTTYKSNAITITGINMFTDINISGGKYRITRGGSIGSWTDTNDTYGIFNNDIIELNATSPSSQGSTKTVTVTIGGVTKTYTVSTTAATPAPAPVYVWVPDTTPDSFKLNAVTDANLSDANQSRIYESNEITVSGIDTNVNLSIIGGEYSLNAKAYTSAYTEVKSGDKIKVRLASSTEYNSTKQATLTIGNGNPTPFSVTTRAKDITPNTFSFDAVTGAGKNSSVTSKQNIIVLGLLDLADLKIVGGEYSLNGGAWSDKNLTATIKNDDNISIRLTTTNDYNKTSIAKLTIGDYTAEFKITTKVQTVFIDGVEKSNKDVTVNENSSFVANINANGQNLKYSVDSGLDRYRFIVDQKGTLSFASPVDYENPQNERNSSVYNVIIAATDGISIATQELNITVVDINEPPLLLTNTTATAYGNQYFSFEIKIKDPEKTLVKPIFKELPQWISDVQSVLDDKGVSVTTLGGMPSSDKAFQTISFSYSDGKTTLNSELNVSYVIEDADGGELVFPVDVKDETKPVYTLFKNDIISDGSDMNLQNIKFLDNEELDTYQLYELNGITSNKKAYKYTLRLFGEDRALFKELLSVKKFKSDKAFDKLVLQTAKNGKLSKAKLQKLKVVLKKTNYKSLIKIAKRSNGLLRGIEQVKLAVEPSFDFEDNLILKWDANQSFSSIKLFQKEGNAAAKELTLSPKVSFAKVKELKNEMKYEFYLVATDGAKEYVSDVIDVDMPQRDIQTVLNEEYEKNIVPSNELAQLLDSSTKVTLAVKKGWNLSSLPANKSLGKSGLEEVFGDSKIEALMKYSGGYQVWQNAKNIDTKKYITMDKFAYLDSTEGLWIKALDDLDVTIAFKYRELAENDKNQNLNYVGLSVGWNLVGVPYEMSTQTLVDFVKSSYGNYTPTLMWIFNGKNWFSVKTDDESASGGFNSAYKIKDTNGIWLKLK